MHSQCCRRSGGVPIHFLEVPALRVYTCDAVAHNVLSSSRPSTVNSNGIISPSRSKHRIASPTRSGILPKRLLWTSRPKKLSKPHSTGSPNARLMARATGQSEQDFRSP